MSLPILTTAEDAQKIAQYLKTKPTGVTITDAKKVLAAQVLDARKISAYVQWGLVQRDGDRLRLTDRGWELARKPESDTNVFQAILDTVPTYQAALEWIHHHGLNTVTNNDVAAHWHEHHKDTVGTDNDGSIKDMAVCFFRLAEAAGLGHLTIGRKGQATRLTLDRESLRRFIETSNVTSLDQRSAIGVRCRVNPRK